MKLRLVSRLIVVALVVLVGGFMLLRTHPWDAAEAAKLQGTDLGSVPAADFTLVDQDGVAMSLDGLRGRPVVLTFMGTRYPDDQQRTAAKLGEAVRLLGDRAGGVHWIAVSVDPSGDTPTAARTFVTAHGLGGYLHYLLGQRAQLEPIWSAYHVAVAPDQGTQVAMDGGAAAHTSGVYVLDAQCRERIYLDADFDPGVLAGDLRTLLGT